MKNVCIGTLFLLCIVPVLLWPMEESLHPLPASLAEEGFKVAGRHPRAVRSTPATATTSSRKTSTKSPVPAERKVSTTTHHTGPTLTPTHHSQLRTTKKTKLNRPTKPGKKYTPRHHQQKKHKKITETKAKRSDKSTSKSHLNNGKQ
ncbi:uncharacterized protein LOC124192990 [Daphnia pulex]|uniref:uncharacterized protein LOC124192990 n=1 Tax=Daphnia pulex TaxID=6669 RepID=UPI001EE143EE|nr:uncharacterized protein LOC124192990 [Daphnia pulex]